MKPSLVLKLWTWLRQSIGRALFLPMAEFPPMEATIVFRLPEASEEFEAAMKGAAYRAALHAYRLELYRRVKHCDALSREAAEAWEQASDAFWRIMRDHDVDL